MNKSKFLFKFSGLAMARDEWTSNAWVDNAPHIHKNVHDWPAYLIGSKIRKIFILSNEVWELIFVDGVRYSIGRLDKKMLRKKCRLFARINHQIRNSKSFNEKLNSRLWHLIQLQNTWKGSVSIYTSFSLDGWN